ncbi:glucose dehydrogenase [Bradyrhizobium sp. S3.2.6]|uniref:Pyrrolo-quinoline quinone repeat domain-containing protein n=1 Tax=Bradyrhizobium cytisi TaxID=515489 RepID=A0A5S4WTV9_9BRAD|nr:hypothetical protein FXB38_14035 [Bradyrhizobium cytisi]
MAGRLRYLVGLVVLLVARPCVAWESWGGDPGGSRFSPLRQITSDNVGQLVRAFEFHTGGRFFAASSAIALTIVALVIAGLRWRRRRRIRST